MKWFMKILLLGFIVSTIANAVEMKVASTKNGGVAVGPVASNLHEFGLEADYYSSARAARPDVLDLWRISLGGHFWQSKDKGPDVNLEGGYCRGYLYYGCLMVGLRQQNKYANYANLTFEVGTSFMLAAYFRPMFRLSRAADYKPYMNNASMLYEAGLKLKLPVYAF